MKLHRLLVLAVATALKEIFREGKYADKVIERLLKSDPRWGSRDRAFIAGTVYDMVRGWRLLCTVAGQWNGQEGAVVESADFVRLTGVHFILKNEALPPWEEFEGLDAAAMLNSKTLLEGERKVAQSVPDWLDETGLAALGDNWPRELEALNRPAGVVLRTNTIKTSKPELLKLLAEEGLEAFETPLAPDALVLHQRANVFQSPLFKKGYFEVQDAGSQCIAPFLDAEPGMRVIDACSGAGGKSLHLAALMQNKGSIISLDTEAWKLEELRRRARRNGVHIIQTRHIDSTKVIKRLQGSADRLLLDVPCSGLGTLRRNPDAKWKLSPAFLEEVRELQARILHQYCSMLRPGGRMVYATCSILPSENEEQVRRFLKHEAAYTLLGERSISPAMHGFDGFYMAIMEKKA